MAVPGQLDRGFGIDGKVQTDLGGDDRAGSVAIAPTGAIVVAEASGGNFALVRYDRAGQLDPSFGRNGTVVTDLGSDDDAAGALVLEPDGRIVVAGNRGSDLTIVRYRRDGALDRTFGRDGVLVTDLGGEERAVAARFLPDGRLDRTFARTVTDFGGVDTPFELALQPDGKIVAVGASSPTSTSLVGDVAVARYLSSR